MTSEAASVQDTRINNDPSMARTSEDDIEELGSQDDDEEEEDLVSPLVSSSNRGSSSRNNLQDRIAPRKSRFSMSISNGKDHDDDDYDDKTTCWGDTWKFAASLLLTTLLLAPLIYSHVSHHNSNTTAAWYDDDDDDKQQDSVSRWPVFNESLCSNGDFDPVSLLESMKEIGHRNETYCRADSMEPTSQGCRCKSPLLAQSKGTGFWEQALERNVGLIAERPVNATSGTITSLDVVFYGDSITEHWMGTDVGVIRRSNAPVHQVFRKTFLDTNSAYKGMALGISGDVCGELLYRLQHGELPDSLHPPVIWILMGANDLGHGCSMASVLAGVINLLEYLCQVRPSATIVINSLLPALLPNRTVHETSLIERSEWVNNRLACYAADSSSPDNILFFNATSLFIDDHDHIIGIHDFVHPNGEGSQIWANAIVKQLDHIFGKEG